MFKLLSVNFCHMFDKFKNFAKILRVVDEATSDEDIVEYFKENSFLP